MTPEGVIEQWKSRVGWARWGCVPNGASGDSRAARRAPRYEVCNATRASREPSKTGFDETRPHLLLVGMALSAYAIGAEQCTCSFAASTRRTAILQRAIDDATRRVSWRACQGHASLPIKSGAGRAYICGEETRCSRRSRASADFPHQAPFPRRTACSTADGLNNVETLWSCRLIRTGRTGSAVGSQHSSVPSSYPSAGT